jgi:putative ABC transport system ATP-binding protein
MNNYFEIKNLKCSYKRKENNPKIVLQIDKMDIPRSEVVFIVGQSGCGKSTILETLGLMNNTMLAAEDTKFIFYPNEKEEIDYLTVWEKSNKLISKIRLNHFSFIFQQTNLMKNFNIYENIALTRMLQGANEVECMRATNEILQSVDMGDFIIINNGAWDRKSKIFDQAHEVSGGQQQRIAFARAMVSDFNILFCDEPTGNLDPKTADEIMKYLRDNIDKKENATAIIVSHNLKLAVKYGDRIIKIFRQTDDDEYCGHINNDSLFAKQGEKWIHNGKELFDYEMLEKLTT